MKHETQQTLTLTEGLLRAKDGQEIDLTRIMACLNHFHRRTQDTVYREAADELSKLSGIGQLPSGEFVALENVNKKGPVLDHLMDRTQEW